MAEKTNFKGIIVLIVLSWFAAALFAFLFVFARAENIKLKSAMAIAQAQNVSLKHTSDEYEKLKTEKSKWDEATVKYFNWQFVLKDQISISEMRILNAIKEIPDLKKDKELASILYYNLGLAHIMALDFNSAITAFQAAADLKPSDANNYYNLGLLYSIYKNNPKQAVKFYEKFLAYAANSPKAKEVQERIGLLKK